MTETPDLQPDAPPASALARYAAAGAARPGLWRPVLGLVITGALTTGLAVGLLLGVYVLAALEGRSDDLASFLERGGPWSVALYIGGIVLIWPSLWLVLRLLHRQRLSTLFSPERRIRWGEFLRGVGMVVAVSLLMGLMTSGIAPSPERSPLPLATWAAMLVPFLVLIFLQSAAEELVFRGYLLQQMALRSQRPLVWAVLPSILFGFLHFNPALPPVEIALYLGTTFLFGLLAAVTVARTGALATAMGLHFAMNVIAITLVAQEGMVDGAALFVQRGPGSMADLMIAALSLAILLVWVVSPVSPVPRADGPAGTGVSRVPRAGPSRQ